MAGIVGAIQALEAIKWILQLETLSGKLLKIDALSWKTKLYQIAPIEQSSVEIDQKTFRQLLGNAQMIDIREEEEKEDRVLPFIAIPLSRLMSNPSQIKQETKTVLCCQHGLRSARAAIILRERFQFEEIYSLRGGIAEYSQSVDDNRI